MNGWTSRGASFLVAAVLTTAPAGAQVTEIEPGVRYDAGTRVGVAALGTSFVIPTDWIGTLPPGAEAFVLGSEVTPGLVLVTGDEADSVEAVKLLFSDPLPMQDGVVLLPQGAPVVEERHVSQSYSATGGGQSLVGQARAVVGDEGVVVAFVALGPAERADEYRALVGALAGSVRFVAPVIVSPPATGSAVDWDALVRGRKLHYIYSDTGFTDEDQIDLCADGTFAKRGGGGGFGGGTPGASGAWQHSGGGTWSISGNVLRLHYSNGEEGSYTLSYENEKLYLDGSRYFRVETDSCP